MDSLSGILAFVRSAEAGSFVGAGRTLGISASAVGKSVARLEAQMGVRLFQRSTRHIRLTTEGSLFYERCQRILDELQDAQAMLSHAAEAPRGKLRISLPNIGYRFLLPVLPTFMQRYPEIALELDFSDRMVDVIEEGLDGAIRSGELPDSRLMARRLGSFRFMLCASPAYLAQRGTPRNPVELEQHACLRYRFQTSGKLQEWALRPAATPRELRLPTALTCNNMEAMLAAAINGLGIAYMPDFLARDALAAGSLQSVLDADLIDPGQFWIVWPSNRQLSPKLRVFVDFVCEHLFTEN
ncbi:LysR family transcriptional regulator [Paraherbaspirillum soli]|uniref:LysR family transcriptional regulator n=1 Tax=Paraherbaspirillum soli TaxID=631222 RepID=A0ABW0MC15_9BURK